MREVACTDCQYRPVCAFFCGGNTLPTAHQANPIRISISACLLGQEVRFNGGHKRDRYLTDTLGRYFQWVPVCPEVEIRLGTPRETIRRVQLGDDIRLRSTNSDVDLTHRMQSFGVSDEEVATGLRERRAIENQQELLVLYEMIAEKLRQGHGAAHRDGGGSGS